LLAAVEAAPAASGWGAALVRYELLMLAELGFGLDLERCAVSGDDEDLIAVSPRSGRAVSAAEAEPYLGKLLILPRFIHEGGSGNWEDILEGLALSGHFLMRDVITDRLSPVAEGRARLVDRMKRAAGLA
jgi:DNA repair protein RecO (recombination protein O)